jgi:tRNA threonylcarbamoyladenosine biosynthesis protein TsaE
MTEASVFLSGSIEDTNTLASHISDLIKPGDVLILNGELGAGKTTLVNGILQSLGIDSSGSPTFIIANTYKTIAFPVYHIDFYRIDSNDELFERGIPDLIGDLKGISIIEWANLYPEIIPEENLIVIEIENGQNENERIFRVSFPDERTLNKRSDR